MTGRPAISGDGGSDDHDVLSAYLDGELPDVERRTVEARLAGSDALRAELAEVRAARDALRRLPEPEPPEGFWEAVVASVGAAGADVVVAATRGAPVRSLEAQRRRRRAAWTGAAAAVLAAIVAVVVLPGRRAVRPDVVAVAVQHGASSATVVDPISALVPAGPTMEPPTAEPR